MINSHFCPSWHLEHIRPTGTGTDMIVASGIVLPFAPIFWCWRDAGKESFPVASITPSPTPPQGNAVWAHLGAKHIKQGWYLWCGKGLLFIQRTEDVEMIHWSPLTPLFLFFLHSTLFSFSLFYSLLFLSSFFCLPVCLDLPFPYSEIFPELILLLMHQSAHPHLRALTCTCGSDGHVKVFESESRSHCYVNITLSIMSQKRSKTSKLIKEREVGSHPLKKKKLTTVSYYPVISSRV